jgi:hypothetical protein
MGGHTYIETDRHDEDDNVLEFCKHAYKGENCAN